MERILTAIIAMLALLLAAGCTTAEAETACETFLSVDDVLVEHHVEADEQVRWECLELMPDMTAEEPEDAEADLNCDEQYEAAYAETDGYASSDSADGFKGQGVREGVDSATETWYSSNQAYHYRTGEWSVDSDGYYRDSEGYYVVASSDYEQGSVINTSKGEARVLDDGTYAGNVDFYTSW